MLDYQRVTVRVRLAGYFVDGPPLMTALGQSSVVLAMQTLPATVVVAWPIVKYME